MISLAGDLQISPSCRGGRLSPLHPGRSNMSKGVQIALAAFSVCAGLALVLTLGSSGEGAHEGPPPTAAPEAPEQ